MKLTVAGLIQMYSMLLGDNCHELVSEKKKYALSILYQVVESKDGKYMNLALFLIAGIQMELENYDESEKCIKELTNYFVDPMILKVSLLQKQGKNKEAETLCKSMLLNYLNQSAAMLSILSRIAKSNHDFNKSLLYLDALNELQSTFKIGLNSGAYNLCRLYIEEEKKELAAKWFERYIDGVIAAEYDYANNPYFENLQLEINLEGQSVIRKKMFQTLIDEEELKVLSGIPEYEQAIEKLKVVLNY